MGAVTFEPRAVAPTIRDAVSRVVWRTRGLDCHAIDLLLFLEMSQWKDGAHVDFACARQIKYSRLGRLTPVYQVA